jgi:hypothetical protein
LLHRNCVKKRSSWSVCQILDNWKSDAAMPAWSFNYAAWLGCLRISTAENLAELVVCEEIPGVSVISAYRLIEIIVEYITLLVIQLIAMG